VTCPENRNVLPVGADHAARAMAIVIVMRPSQNAHRSNHGPRPRNQKNGGPETPGLARRDKRQHQHRAHKMETLPCCGKSAALSAN
jgi:hypothetical protein